MQQYLDELRYVLKNGHDRSDRTGIGTRATFGGRTEFDLRQGFPIITTKKIAFRLIKAELLWFLKGSQDIRELQALDCHIWDANAFAPTWLPKAAFPGDVGTHYGVLWRRWRSAYAKKEIDQVARVIERLKKEPYGRRALVTAWEPGALQHTALPPCHMFYQFFVEGDGSLSLQMYQRSCDMFLGVPFNISSYALLLSLVAQVTERKPGRFIHVLGDAHIYRNHFEQVREQLTRQPLPLPQLLLNPAIKDIDGFTMEDIRLEGYTSHPAIKAPMAV